MTQIPTLMLFTGELGYFLRKEIKRLKESFIEKYGENNISEFRKYDFDIGEWSRAIQNDGLFAQKKLIITYGFPMPSDKAEGLSKENCESIRSRLEKMVENRNNDTIVIFVSPKMDKRSKISKDILKYATHKTFDTDMRAKKRLPEIERDIAEASGNYISPALQKKLGEKLKRQPDHILNEVRKIISYCVANKKDQIEEKDIEKIIYFSDEVQPFAFISKLRDNNKSLLEDVNLAKENGQFRLLYLGVVYRCFKALILGGEALKSGETNQYKLMGMAGLSPQVASQLLKHKDKILKDEKKLQKAYADLVEIDKNIKSGIYTEGFARVGIKEVVGRFGK